MVAEHIFHLHFSTTCSTTSCITCHTTVSQPEANKENVQDEQPASDDDEKDKIEREAENKDGFSDEG